jgi:hypothetical protein
MQIGDHLVSSRIGYSHHGLYIGNNQVIHYSGLANGLSSGSIATATLKEFGNGNEIRVKHHDWRKYTGQESVDRAFTRLGEDWYNLLINNCEHFVNWCIEGSHSSDQVQRAVTAVSVANELAKYTNQQKNLIGVIGGLGSKAIYNETGRQVGNALIQSALGSGVDVLAKTVAPAIPVLYPVTVAYGLYRLIDLALDDW